MPRPMPLVAACSSSSSSATHGVAFPALLRRRGPLAQRALAQPPLAAPGQPTQEQEQTWWRKTRVRTRARR